MNAPSNETQGISLPAPVTEQYPAQPAGQYAEQMPPVSEQAPAPMAAPPLPPVAAMPASSPVPQAPLADQTSASSASNDASATTDDSDLIEKEWVERAKKVIDQNRDDPFKQSEELTHVKADYLKQHYDKTIKTDG